MTDIKEKTTYEKFCKEFSQAEVDKWLEKIEMEDLFRCMEVLSNDCLMSNFDPHHREKDLNILDCILENKIDSRRLYASATYGTKPNYTCKCHIGHITQRNYKNFDIATTLMELKQEEMKEWLLDNHNFSEREKKLLFFYEK